MAIRQDQPHRTKSISLFPLNALIAGLALTLAFIAIQSPFI
ncbi:MAG TPA: hypothetical protein VMR52_00765 [Dehalococcoidia bacterium]|nr:hypothetical protein [Dehalococcoidia bacterium]